MSKTISMCRTNTGMGNIIGNVTLIVRDFIKRLFPNDFFKSEFVDTQLIQTEMTKEEILHKDKPCLVIRPKVSLDDDSLFGKLPDWLNTNYFIYTHLDSSYLPVFRDDENQIYMYTNGDRIKMNFEIEILLPTKLQQINTAFFLKGSVLHKSYFYLNNCRLEAELPKYFIRQISAILDKNLNDKEDRDNFNLYINEHSQHYVSEKIKLASGNLNYFYRFSSNLLCLFENNPDLDDGETQGMTQNNFKITENLSLEFWSPMTYFLEIGRKFDILEIESRDLNILDEGEKISINFTMKFDPPVKYKDMDLYKKISYITDDDKERDIVDISELFNKHDTSLIRYCLDNNILVSNLFHISVYLDDKIVDENHILIDWNKMEVINIKPKINDVYTMVLYKNGERYNRLEHIIDTQAGLIYN